MSQSSKQQAKELTKINKYISRRARELRIQNKLTQSDISRFLGVTRNSVSDMMAGNSGFTPRTIYLLCYIFKCEVSDLFPPQGALKINEIKIGKIYGFQKSKLKII